MFFRVHGTTTQATISRRAAVKRQNRQYVMRPTVFDGVSARYVIA